MTLDSQAAHELADQMRSLTSEVAGLRASFNIYGPMIESQVGGLNDLTNRQTKTDGRVLAIEERLKEDRESRRWAFAQILVAVGAVTAIVQVLINTIGHK